MLTDSSINFVWFYIYEVLPFYQSKRFKKSSRNISKVKRQGRRLQYLKGPETVVVFTEPCFMKVLSYLDHDFIKYSPSGTSLKTLILSYARSLFFMPTPVIVKNMPIASPGFLSDGGTVVYYWSGQGIKGDQHLSCHTDDLASQNAQLI